MAKNQHGFLNVDLEITCTNDLDVLTQALSASMTILFQDNSFASLEINEQYDDPSQTIIRIADIIEALDTPIRNIWNNTEQRVLNVGAQASGKYSDVVRVTPQAAACAAKIGAGLAFTIYKPVTINDA